MALLTLPAACSKPSGKVAPKANLPRSGEDVGQAEFELATDFPSVPDTVKIYKVVHPNITAEWVTELGRKFGFTGEARQPAEGQESTRILDKETGAVLRVFLKSGGVEYYASRNLDPILYVKNPSLPSYEEAERIATDFLTEKGLLPADRYVEEVDVGGTYGGVVTHLLVTFGRDIDGIPVSGGKFSVRVGDKGEIGQAMIMHREVEPYQQDVPIKSPAEAFEDLKDGNVGEGVPVYTQPPRCAKVVIDEMYLVYLMGAIVSKQEYVTPLYKFKGERLDEADNFLGGFTGWVQAVK